MGELVASIYDLAADLPDWMDAPPKADLQTFESLQEAAENLWTLWRGRPSRRPTGDIR